MNYCVYYLLSIVLHKPMLSQCYTAIKKKKVTMLPRDLADMTII